MSLLLRFRPPKNLTMGCHLAQGKWTKAHFEALKCSIMEFSNDFIHIHLLRGFSVTRRSVVGYWNEFICFYSVLERMDNKMIFLDVKYPLEIRSSTFFLSLTHSFTNSFEASSNSFSARSISVLQNGNHERLSSHAWWLWQRWWRGRFPQAPPS